MAGQYGQRSAGATHRGESVFSARRPASVIDIAQWCLPLRRQQAGNCDSLLCPSASRGAKSGRRNAVSSRMGRDRRNI